jgi:hypothetical protein
VEVCEQKACNKRRGLSPRHADNSDVVSEVESQVFDNFHCTCAKPDTKMSAFTMKATYQWALKGLVIQVVLFHCASSGANDLQMQQWLQQN